LRVDSQRALHLKVDIFEAASQINHEVFSVDVGKWAVRRQLALRAHERISGDQRFCNRSPELVILV